MVLLLSLLRATTVVKLSIIANFHVVNLSFRLNKMVVNAMHHLTSRERKKQPGLSELTQVFCGLLSLLSKNF